MNEQKIERFFINGQIKETFEPLSFEIVGEGNQGETLIYVNTLPCPSCKKNKWFLCSSMNNEEMAACYHCENEKGYS